jgi:signal transduction histidine kinase
MTALNMAARHGPLRRFAAFRMTLGVRVALTFAGLFLVTGAALLAVNYALFSQKLGVRAQVPTYSAAYIISYDRALLSNPQVPALEQAAARGQLALALAHPTQEFNGAGLLPTVNTRPPAPPGGSPDQKAQSQLLRQSTLILIPLALLAVALGWLTAQRMLRPVRQLTAAARRMSAANLSQRLRLAGPDDELKELGDTFDQMLARLDAAFDSQRRFVANASHELRTPLTIMRTELDVTLGSKAADIESLRAMGQVIRAAVTRSERLVDGLLGLAESERGIDRAERVDLAELVGPALDHVAGRARQAGIRTAATLHEAPVVGRRVLLERLVENLADNGIRHNRPGGWLAIVTARRDDTVTLIVESSGPPITADQAASLFEPFRRLHADRVGSARGSGLGLSIVRAVARAHAGEATASPVAGGGLRVTVTLPALRPAAAGARHEPVKSGPGPLGGSAHHQCRAPDPRLPREMP